MEEEPEKKDPNAPAGGVKKVSLVVPLVIAGAFFMEGLDSSIITTSLPQMASSLNVSAAQMSAAITAYLLSLAIFIPVSGWIADRFGARLVFCSAIACFTFGSVLCGLSETLLELVGGRIVQGFGGAMMTPVGRLILTRSFPKDQLMRAMTWNLLPGTIGPTVGPLVGGFITTYYSWHWNFFLNVPLGIIAIALAIRFIPNIRVPYSGRFDWTGFFIIAIGLGTAQLAIENFGRNTVALPIEITMIVVAAIALYFYGRHARRHENPVVDLRLFRIRPFAISIIGGSVTRIGLFSINFLMPLLLQVGFGLTPLTAGQIMVALTLGSIAVRTNITRAARKLGFRNLLSYASIITAFFMVGFAFLTPETPHPVIAAYLFCFGLIRTGQLTSLSALSYAEIPQERMARATAIAALAQRGSQSMGISIAASLLGIVAGSSEISVSHFPYVFLAMAVVLVLPSYFYWRLRPDDGAEVSGHRKH